MDEQAIASAIPPLFASLGGLMPFWIVSNPIHYPKGTLAILLVLYVIIVWEAYFICLLLGEMLFFPPAITIAALLLSIGFIYLVIRGFLRARSLPDERRKAERDPRRMTRYYLLGIFFGSFGFTNYLGTSGKVFLVLRDADGLTRIEATRHDDVVVALRPYPAPRASAGMLLSKEFFDSLKSLEIYHRASGSEESGTRQHDDLYEHQLRPWGAGKRYEIALR